MIKDCMYLFSGEFYEHISLFFTLLLTFNNLFGIFKGFTNFYALEKILIELISKLDDRFIKDLFSSFNTDDMACTTLQEYFADEFRITCCHKDNI